MSSKFGKKSKKMHKLRNKVHFQTFDKQYRKLPAQFCAFLCLFRNKVKFPELYKAFNNMSCKYYLFYGILK